MIPTLLKINWINLRRDYVALGLIFVLPIIFFSIFAGIFSGSGGNDGASATKILVVDLDNTDITGRLINALYDQAALRVFTRPKSTEPLAPEGSAAVAAQASLTDRVAGVMTDPDSDDDDPPQADA